MAAGIILERVVHPGVQSGDPGSLSNCNHVIPALFGEGSGKTLRIAGVSGRRDTGNLERSVDVGRQDTDHKVHT